MNKLIIKETGTTPSVHFDPERNYYEMRGNSIVLNALEFYTRVAQWLRENNSEIQSGSRFIFNLPFFNSASSKGIVMVLKEIRQLQQKKPDIFVVWRVEEDDEFMKEAGENFSEFLEMNFVLENLP